VPVPVTRHVTFVAAKSIVHPHHRLWRRRTTCSLYSSWWPGSEDHQDQAPDLGGPGLLSSCTTPPSGTPSPSTSVRLSPYHYSSPQNTSSNSFTCWPRYDPWSRYDPHSSSSLLSSLLVSTRPVCLFCLLSFCLVLFVSCPLWSVFVYLEKRSRSLNYYYSLSKSKNGIQKYKCTGPNGRGRISKCFPDSDMQTYLFEFTTMTFPGEKPRLLALLWSLCVSLVL